MYRFINHIFENQNGGTFLNTSAVPENLICLLSSLSFNWNLQITWMGIKSLMSLNSIPARLDNSLWSYLLLNAKNTAIRKKYPPGFNCLTSVAPASGLAAEYLSCFISVMNLDLYVHCSHGLIEQLVCVYEPQQNPGQDWALVKPV